MAALDQENAVPGIEMPASERLLVLSLTTQPVMHFARWLLGQAALRLEAFWLIAGLQLPGVEPIHVATVAPSGVWLYEVVDWSGHLICNAGLWARRERRDGQVVHLPVEGTPDQALRRKAREVARATGTRLMPLLVRSLAKGVGGAVVFTNPSATCTAVRPLAPCVTFGHLRAGRFPFEMGLLLPWQACRDWNFPEWNQSEVLEMLLEAHQVDPRTGFAQERALGEARRGLVSAPFLESTAPQGAQTGEEGARRG